MAEHIADRCVLVKGFTDFDVLPDLLAMTSDPAPGAPDSAGGNTLRFHPGHTPIQWEIFLKEWGVNKDHIEPGEFEAEAGDYFWFAQDVKDLVHRMRWISETEEPSEQGRVLAEIGRRPWGERTLEDERAIGQALRDSIAEHYVADNGLSVVDVLQFGTRLLGQSRQEWPWFAPGLLMIEFWALIYWAFKDPQRAVELCDELVVNREAALALVGVKSREIDGGEPITIELLADATGSMYLDQRRLAADTGLKTTWVRSTAMLLTYAGLLEEFVMGPVSYFFLPSPEEGHG